MRPGDPGIVVTPYPYPDADAQPYPRGMVIAPPDIGDGMALPLASPWAGTSRTLWQTLGDGLASMWGALQSPQAPPL